MSILKKYSIKILWAAVSKIPIFPKGLRPWDKVGVTKELLARIYNRVSSMEFNIFLEEYEAQKRRAKELRKKKKEPYPFLQA